MEMNILYCPILEPGAFHPRAVKNKHGLYTALVNAGHRVVEYDYLDRKEYGNLHGELHDLMRIFEPDLFLSQLHGADVIPIWMIEDFRELYPEMQWINWSGDSHRHSLLGDSMINLMKRFDWLLVPTLDVLPELKAVGVNAAYWNIAYEPIFTSLPDMPEYDIVFQGNVFNDQRRELVRMLRTLPYRVGIYGDWEGSDGNTSYDFAAQQALYRQARLAIADNYRPDDLNYVSDRPMNIMVAGGALCLHQRVEMMQALTGWKNGVHYIEWKSLDDLEELIHSIMNNWTMGYSRIVNTAQEQVLIKHSFTARVNELFEKWVRV